MGCGLGLDDFGTGFSSFSYLKELPVQHLKIDIEFIRDLRTSPVDQRLVQAMAEFARAFGQETVAEGVEDAETLTLVRGCRDRLRPGLPHRQAGRSSTACPSAPRPEPPQPPRC